MENIFVTLQKIGIGIAFSLLVISGSLAQSNIQQSLSVNGSGTAAHASAQLDVSATDKGMLVPRMTSAQRTAIASPATGLLMFDTDTGGFWFYNGTAWTDLSAPKTLADADNDTKIQVEESPDEDIIRFDLNGSEYMVLRKNVGGSPRLELSNALVNTFVGTEAGLANTTGFANTALGAFALKANTIGESNTAIGRSTLLNNTDGDFNVAVGDRALLANTTGESNVAMGGTTMFNNTTGSSNTALGTGALGSNTTGYSNTAIGRRALLSNTSSSNLVAVGDSALYNNIAGTANVALGSKALFANTSGYNNTASGYQALSSNTTGVSNTATGAGSLSFNTIGFNNTANGFGSLLYNTTGYSNTAVGVYAVGSNTIGTDNTGIGNFTLQFNTSGIENTAIGATALSGNTIGSYSTASGFQALLSNTTGSNNTANGTASLSFNTTGNVNTAIGQSSLFSNTTGSNNTALGAYADVTTGALTNATAIGYNAKVGASNSLVLGGTGADAVNVGVGITTPSSPMHVNAIGNGFAHTAGGIELITYADPNYAPVGAWIGTASDHPLHFFTNFSAAPQTTLLQNGNFGIGTSNPLAKLHVNGSLIATGITDADNDTKIQVEKNPDEDIIRFDVGGTEGMSLRKNAYDFVRLDLNSGLNNTFLNGGNANTTGLNGTFIGTGAGGANTTGFDNTALGFSALGSSTTSYNNTAVGSIALSSNSTGIYNTAVGTSALRFNATGNNNAAFGADALYNSTGHSNTAIGTTALFANTSGNDNVAIGGYALDANTTGSGNVGVGKDADVTTGNLSNAIVIGVGTTVNASNKIRLGNTAITTIEGQVAYTFPSDARFKFNIHDDAVPGLAFIEKLRPVTYQFDTRKFDEHLMQNMPDSIQQRRMAGQDYSKSTALVQTGFLAQEVEQVCKDLNFTFSGLHVPTSEVDNYGLAYGSFVPLLVKGMQEQQTIIEAQKEEIDLLKSQLDKITAALQGAGIAVEK